MLRFLSNKIVISFSLLLMNTTITAATVTTITCPNASEFVKDSKGRWTLSNNPNFTVVRPIVGNPSNDYSDFPTGDNTLRMWIEPGASSNKLACKCFYVFPNNNELAVESGVFSIDPNAKRAIEKAWSKAEVQNTCSTDAATPEVCGIDTGLPNGG